MLNQEDRAAKFFDAITKDAEERHEEMTRKTRETVESGLEKAKKKAHAQAQARIERERTLREQEFNRTVAGARTEQRARLTGKRGEITDAVFDSARDKLVAFTVSEKYEEFLKKSAAEFARVFPEGRVTVFVRESDLRFEYLIKSSFGRDCAVESSDDIKIGGCRAELAGGSTVADDTLDTRLDAQREWFLENAGMSVIL